MIKPTTMSLEELNIVIKIRLFNAMNKLHSQTKQLLLQIQEELHPIKTNIIP